MMMIKSKNSRKDGNRAFPPIMESDWEKWKIPETPVRAVSRSRVQPSSRGPFKGASYMADDGVYHDHDSSRVYACTAYYFVSQPLLSQGTVALSRPTRRCRRCRRTRCSGFVTTRNQLPARRLHVSFPRIFSCPSGFSFSSRLAIPIRTKLPHLIEGTRQRFASDSSTPEERTENKRYDYMIAIILVMHIELLKYLKLCINHTQKK